jgi:hypothetical protein
LEAPFLWAVWPIFARADRYDLGLEPGFFADGLREGDCDQEDCPAGEARRMGVGVT